MTAVVAFANIFTIIEPLTSGDYVKTIWMIAGPLLFGIIALLLYGRGERQ